MAFLPADAAYAPPVQQARPVSGPSRLPQHQPLPQHSLISSFSPATTSGVLGPPEEEPAAKRKATGRICLQCKATTTPQWREGPEGKRRTVSCFSCMHTLSMVHSAWLWIMQVGSSIVHQALWWFQQAKQPAGYSAEVCGPGPCMHPSDVGMGHAFPRKNVPQQDQGRACCVQEAVQRAYCLQAPRRSAMHAVCATCAPCKKEGPAKL